MFFFFLKAANSARAFLFSLLLNCKEPVQHGVSLSP